MNSQEFKAFLETNDSQEVTGAELKALVDRERTLAIKAFRENHPSPAPVVDETAITERDEKINRLKVDLAVARECHARGIDEALLDDFGIRFQSVEEVQPRLEIIGSRLAEMQREKTTQELVNGFRPGGSTLSPAESVRDMSPERIQFLETIGQLDGLLQNE